MVKTNTVAQLRPIATTLPATKTVEKGRRLCFELKSPESALDDVTSEHQSNGRKQKAQAVHMNNATGVERQRRRTRNQTKNAIKEELQCIADLKLYAAYLGLESGVLLEHPWIQKLIDVSRTLMSS
ncbi:g7670 [Coccomyxa elongata]